MLRLTHRAWRFLLAFARHLGGESAVHFIATRSAPLTLAESHTAARLLRGVRVAEAAGPDPLAGVTHLRTERGLERVEDIAKTAPADGGPTADDLKELTHSLYREYLHGPQKLAALFDDLNRRRCELEEGINGYRVLALRGSTGEPATVEINGARFEYVWPEKPWGNPKQHGPVERGDTIEVKVSDVDDHGTPRLLNCAGRVWRVSTAGWASGTAPSPGTQDVAQQAGQYLDNDAHQAIQTREDYERVRDLLELLAGVNAHLMGALLHQLENYLKTPVAAIDFNNPDVRRATHDQVAEAATQTLRKLEADGVLTFHGTPKPAKVLEQWGSEPQYVEIEGHAYQKVRPDDEAKLHARLERNRISKRFASLIRDNAEAWEAFQAYSQMDFKERDAELTETLRKVGRFLVDSGQRGRWKVLFLDLQDHELTSDAIICALPPRDAYRENDELLFALGEHWERYVRGVEEQLSGGASTEDEPDEQVG